MKLYFSTQDTITVIPTLQIFWDRNYQTGGLYTVDIYIPWGMWCVGVVWSDTEHLKRT